MKKKERMLKIISNLKQTLKSFKGSAETVRSTSSAYQPARATKKM